MKNSKILLSLRVTLRKGEDVLIIRRSNNDTWNPGLWEFPGGKVDFGEDLNEALRRETKEETGIDVTIKEPLFLWDEPTDKEKYKDLRHVILFFECEAPINSKVKLSSEHNGAKWIKLKNIGKEKITAHTEDVLRRLIA